MKIILTNISLLKLCDLGKLSNYNKLAEVCIRYHKNFLKDKKNLNIWKYDILKVWKFHKLEFIKIYK